MTMRFLTVVAALASMFGVQQAFAKDNPVTKVSGKKHHKKHKKSVVATTVNPANSTLS